MNRFETEEAEEAAERKALRENPVDDDGFVTVTYKRKRGRNSGNDGNPSEAGGTADKGNKKKRKGAGELSDFYRFQVRSLLPLTGRVLRCTQTRSRVAASPRTTRRTYVGEVFARQEQCTRIRRQRWDGIGAPRRPSLLWLFIPRLTIKSRSPRWPVLA